VRLVGFAYMCVLFLALTAFRLHVEVAAPPAAVPAALVAQAPDAPGAVAGEPLAEAASSSMQGELSVEPVLVEAARSEGPEVVSPPPAPERRNRRRRPNRYPGPIPTPADWMPPEGPVRIALQAGHWRANEAPSELSGLRRNGTRWKETAEWEVNLEIVRRTGAILEEMGYQVDILPAVVPPSYRAHLFIAVHADGSNDPNASGYRVASPSRDATGRAAQVAALLDRSYGEATGIKRLPTTTRRMRNYYAFNFRRYEHALHPMTIAVILETGFLTSLSDRRVLVDDPGRAARGIVAAVTAFSVTPPPRVLSDE
jgi:N-acetylmuramoyl-L-alanine amidase